jgi:hypothetical protein
MAYTVAVQQVLVIHVKSRSDLCHDTRENFGHRESIESQCDSNASLFGRMSHTELSSENRIGSAGDHHADSGVAR